MPHPKTSDWKKYDEVINAGNQGWNPLQRLPVLLEKEYAWMREFNVGFCSETDLAHWRTVGWEHLKTEHFKIDNFNDAIALRFGLTEDAGLIKYNDNWLMIQPKEFRKKVIKARNDSFEDQFAQSATAQGSAPSEDPRKEELDRLSGGQLESHRVQNIPQDLSEGKPAPKRRGRQPKQK
jgi:hypothetical protein